jgi:hypothetical protein
MGHPRPLLCEPELDGPSELEGPTFLLQRGRKAAVEAVQ